jgi:hypothetical protein
MIASLDEYLPLADLVKIVVVCLAVAVVAPAAVSVAIAGLDLRARQVEQRESGASGVALIVLGVAVVCALIGFGLYALFTD